MRDLPTIKQLKIFMRDSKKTILASVLAVMLLFALATAYTVYSTDMDKELKPIDSVTGQEVKPITKSAYNKLQKDKMKFLFYVENAEGNPFSNANLFETFILSPDFVSKIATAAELDKKIPIEYVLDVSYDNSTNGMAVSVATGDYQKNKKVADLIYAAIKEKDFPFFENKTVYMVTEPAKIKQISTLLEKETSVSSYAVMGVAALIFSIFLGLFIACVRMLLKKEISDVFNYKYAETDLVLDLTKLDAASEAGITPELIHAVQYPAAGTKLILCEKGTVEGLENELQKEKNGATGAFIVHNDITQASENVPFDEIIIVSKKNQTTKKWYKNQRIQLENYHSPIKIILI